MKVIEARTEYIAEIVQAEKSACTVDSYGRVLASFGAIDGNDGKEIAEMSHDVITSWIDGLTAKATERGEHQRGNQAGQNSGNSIRYKLTVLGGFFRWAIDRGYMNKSPIRASDYPKKNRPELKLLSDKEIKTLVKSERKRSVGEWKDHAIRDYAIIVFLTQTGVRVSEFIALTIDDLNFERGTVHVLNGKGGKARYTTFPKTAQKAVKEYLNSREGTSYAVDMPDMNGKPLFGHDDGTGNWRGFTRQNISHIVEQYCIRSFGIKGKGITAHDLRHAFASELLTNGADIAKLQGVLGHSNYSTTEIYAKQLCPAQDAGNLSMIFDTIKS